jgi:hypothetical protein
MNSLGFYGKDKPAAGSKFSASNFRDSRLRRNLSIPRERCVITETDDLREIGGDEGDRTPDLMNAISWTIRVKFD